MTGRDKFLKKKNRELNKIVNQQARLIAKGMKLAKKEYKTDAAKMRRLGKVLVIAAQIKTLRLQYLQIASPPFPKFPEGGNSVKGQAIVGDSGKEEVILNLNHLQP